MTKQKKHQMGEGGDCICPKCDSRIKHQAGIPCQDERCPDCGAKLMREGSHHHDLLLAKREKVRHRGILTDRTLR